MGVQEEKPNDKNVAETRLHSFSKLLYPKATTNLSLSSFSYSHKQLGRAITLLAKINEVLLRKWLTV